MTKWIVAALVVWAVWWMLRAPRPASEAAKARRLLGVDARADAAEIRAAHRRLMAEIHPDRGGSAEGARRANEARDLLLARLSRDG